VAEVGGRDLTGERLGSYLLEAADGESAFGRRYRATHVALDSPRMVEVRDAGVDPYVRERFLGEARAAARLEHPNIVAVLDYGAEGDLVYVVTEHVESTTLAERLGRLPVAGRLRDPSVRRWIADVAAGLDHAREAGLPVGPLRPASVLVEAGGDHALLTDYGDVRAFADLLREIVTGAAPPAGGTLPADLETVLADAAMTRYRTAGELARAVVGAPPAGTRQPAPAHVPHRVPRPSARHAAAGAAAVLAGACAVAVAAWAARQPPGPAVPAPGLAAPVVGGLGSPLRVGDLTLTVLSVDTGAPSPSSVRVGPGDRFVAVRVRCQDTGSGAMPVSPYDWVLLDATGTTYGAVVDGLSGGLPQRVLGPGQSAVGEVGFVVPASTPGLRLTFDAERGDASASVPLT
jgi:hypothetical protein